MAVIYIHGKSASIGCLAIGDDAIEDVFYLSILAGIENVKVVISPARDIKSIKVDDPEIIELYKNISGEIKIINTAQQVDAPEPAKPAR